MDHVPLEQPKLQSAGYKKVFFSEVQKFKLFKIHDNKLTFPKGMNYYIQKRIDYEKSCIGIVYKNDTWKKQAEVVIQNLNRISKVIQQIGES